MGTAGVLGASAGAAASVACGFLFVVCAPIFMAVGGVAGAGGVGAMAMAAREPQTDTVTDPLKLLASRIEAFGRANEVDEQLRVALVNKAKPHWHVVPTSSRNSMTVQVTGFALRAESAERISLEIRALVRVNSEDMFQAPMRAYTEPQVGNEGKRASGPAVISATFFHEGAAADIRQWMDESGEFLKTEVARAYEAIAQQIVNTLAGRTAG